VRSDGRQMSASRRQILNIIRAERDAVAFPLGEQLGRFRERWFLRLFDFDSGRGEDAVEAKGVGYDTRDLFQPVSKLGRIRVFRAI